MKPCFNCGTYDGKNKNGNTIALQSTKFGSMCGACIELGAAYLYAKKKGGLQMTECFICKEDKEQLKENIKILSDRVKGKQGSLFYSRVFRTHN